MSRYRISHNLLFAIFPIIFLYASNKEQVSFRYVILPLILAIGITFVFYYLLNLLIRDKLKTEIIVSLFLIVFFSSGHIYYIFQNIRLPLFSIIHHRVLLFIFLILYGFLIIIILRRKGDLRFLNAFMSIIAASLVIMSLFNIAVYHCGLNANKPLNMLVKQVEMPVAARGLPGAKSLAKMDIYYIILDEYASSNTLKDVLAFDNSEFLDFLLNKGFYVVGQSHSNYANTFLSLSSSLNMEYINFLQEILGPDSKDRTLPYRMIRNSEISKFLKSHGYKFVHFNSGWGATNYNNHADLNISCSVVNDFISLIINTTMLLPVVPYLSEEKSSALTLERLSEVSKIPGPKFVFAHILCPHEPALNRMDSTQMSGNNRDENVKIKKEQYLQRLIFLNQKVEEAIDNIFLNSAALPVIIIQADHGTQFTLGDVDDLNSGWGHPNDIMLRERMAILNAYYLPKDGKKYLYDSITPVNTFRLIFNLYFGTHFEILQDRSYFSSYVFPYKFMEATDIINSSKGEKDSIK